MPGFVKIMVMAHDSWTLHLMTGSRPRRQDATKASNPLNDIDRNPKGPPAVPLSKHASASGGDEQGYEYLALGPNDEAGRLRLTVIHDGNEKWPDIFQGMANDAKHRLPNAEYQLTECTKKLETTKGLPPRSSQKKLLVSKAYAAQQEAQELVNSLKVLAEAAGREAHAWDIANSMAREWMPKQPISLRNSKMTLSDAMKWHSKAVADLARYTDIVEKLENVGAQANMAEADEKATCLEDAVASVANLMCQYYTVAQAVSRITILVRMNRRVDAMELRSSMDLEHVKHCILQENSISDNKHLEILTGIIWLQTDLARQIGQQSSDIPEAEEEMYLLVREFLMRFARLSDSCQRSMAEILNTIRQDFTEKIKREVNRQNLKSQLSYVEAESKLAAREVASMEEACELMMKKEEEDRNLKVTANEFNKPTNADLRKLQDMKAKLHSAKSLAIRYPFINTAWNGSNQGYPTYGPAALVRSLESDVKKEEDRLTQVVANKPANVDSIRLRNLKEKLKAAKAHADTLKGEMARVTNNLHVAGIQCVADGSIWRADEDIPIDMPETQEFGVVGLQRQVDHLIRLQRSLDSIQSELRRKNVK
jgi:hypothetical protein